MPKPTAQSAKHGTAAAAAAVALAATAASASVLRYDGCQERAPRTTATPVDELQRNCRTISPNYLVLL